jgi:hypothetical protein
MPSCTPPAPCSRALQPTWYCCWHCLQEGQSHDLPVYFGDAASIQVLHQIGADRAACAVVTLDSKGRSKGPPTWCPAACLARRLPCMTGSAQPLAGALKGSRPLVRRLPAASDGDPDHSACAGCVSAHARPMPPLAGANYRAVWSLHKHFPNIKIYVKAHDVATGTHLEQVSGRCCACCHREGGGGIHFGGDCPRPA